MSGSSERQTVQDLIFEALKRIEQDIRDLRLENKELVRETKNEMAILRNESKALNDETKKELSILGNRLQKLELEFAVFKGKALAYGGMAGVVSGGIVSALIKALLGAG